MRADRRIGQAALISIALLLLVGASALVRTAGLPQRANYTGQTLGQLGRAAPEIGFTAPPFRQPTLSGQPLDLLALRGTPVIINFWATWCGPCRVEMPHLQSLYTRYNASGSTDQALHVVGVNLGEDRDTIAAWVETFDLTFDIVLDPARQIEALYQIRGQPSTYVLDADGIITHIFYGPTTEDQLQQALNAQ
jgi:thiol-disulfide isomerase/thioredoxin